MTKCNPVQIGDAWTCPVCGFSRKARFYRVCRPVIQATESVEKISASPLSPVERRLTEHGAARLARCMASQCGLMHVVDGHMTCVGMGTGGVGKCKWLARWANCLNGHTLFPNGTPDCPHWNLEENTEQLILDEQPE